MTPRSVLHQSISGKTVWLKRGQASLMFPSQIPGPIEACSALKSLRFYYSWLGSGFHLPFTAVSQCFSTETWIFSQRCVCVENEWVREDTCWLHGCISCVCVCGFVQEKGIFKPICDYTVYVCMCVCVHGRSFGSITSRCGRKSRNSLNSLCTNTQSTATPWNLTSRLQKETSTSSWKIWFWLRPTKKNWEKRGKKDVERNKGERHHCL